MNAIVDWKSREIRKRKTGKRRETHYRVYCAVCGKHRWLNKSNAQKAERRDSPCHSCSSVVKGKKGYQTARRNGWTHDKLLAIIADRPQNRGELAVGEILKELCPATGFQSQVIFIRWVLDFALTKRETVRGAIEVNGYHHWRNRAARDAQLRSHIPVLFLDYQAVLENPVAIKDQISAFLKETL